MAGEQLERKESPKALAAALEAQASEVSTLIGWYEKALERSRWEGRTPDMIKGELDAAFARITRTIAEIKASL